MVLRVLPDALAKARLPSARTQREESASSFELLYALVVWTRLWPGPLGDDTVPVMNEKHPNEPGSWDGAGRTFWFSEHLNNKTLRRDTRRRADRSEANLVASLRHDGNHMPTLDIDRPVLLDPSSTEGHYHLYIDVPMSWRAYRRLLRALYIGGVIGRNAYWRSLDRGASFVRPPGVYKTETEHQLAIAGRSDGKREATRALQRARLRVTFKRVLWNITELAGTVTRCVGRGRVRSR